MRLQLVAKMRGEHLFNYPWFEQAASDLRARGHEVVSPTEMDHEAGDIQVDRHDVPGCVSCRTNGHDILWVGLSDSFDYEAALNRCLDSLETVDGVVLGPGWDASPGAERELARARELGLTVFGSAAEVPVAGGDCERRVLLDSMTREAERLGLYDDSAWRKPLPAPVQPELCPDVAGRDIPLKYAYGRYGPITGSYTFPESPEPTISPRAELLDEAKALITGDRNNQYGPPGQDFSRTAALWTAIFEPLLSEGSRFEAHHVAMAMAALKLSRLAWDPDKRDSWVDLAGYAACGYDCIVETGGDE